MGKIFISYCQEDKRWKDRLVKQLGVLKNEGLLEIWEDTQIAGGDDWLPEITKAMDSSQVAVLMITAGFLNSKFILGTEIPHVLKRREEGGMRVMPLIVEPCPWQDVSWLHSVQARPVGAQALSLKTKPKADAALSEFAREINELLKTVPSNTSFPHASSGNLDGIQNRPPIGSFGGDVSDEDDVKADNFFSPDKVDIGHLPTIDPTVFGREKELLTLDEAWRNPQTKILSFIAWGGVGKSALVNAWLNSMQKDNFRGAELVYGWSFYSQGTKEQGQASAETFIINALNWFGHKGEIPASAYEKGQLLAEIIAKKKVLLVLDGLEPLQYPPREMHGYLRDQGMTALLKTLAHANGGLCLITSRCKIEDIKGSEGTSTLRVELENLSEEAGMEVLKEHNITGRNEELLKTSREFGGHALALNLLGSYLKIAFQGDIQKRDLVPKLTEEPKKGGHARRVMESYEKWFQEKEGAELDILNLLGLFDRPATKEAIDVLTTKPAIKGLTERVTELSHLKWQTSLMNLRELRLIAEDKEESGSVDCHPLVREHFGDRIKTTNPEGWQEAHSRLYEYYKNLPKKDLPDSLEEMEPLFIAVTHGCLAGKHQETLDDVYEKRMLREDKAFIIHQLGAFGSALSCLSSFFASPWDAPAEELRKGSKAVLLNWSGFSLRAVGRLREAAQPMKAGLELYIKNERWKYAAIAASSISELLLTLGEIEEAVVYGRQSVEFAYKSEDGFMKESRRTAHADALHQAGREEEAEKLFSQAETMQKSRRSEYPYLYSLQGFHYCDLLLSQGVYGEVLERAKITIKIAETNLHLISIALDHLSIGKASMQKSIADKTSDFSEAEMSLTQAVKGFRKAGHQQYLPVGLLARSELAQHKHNFPAAWKDLEETREIAEFGFMQLHQTDYYLHACRTLQAQLAAAPQKKTFPVILQGKHKNLNRKQMTSTFTDFLNQAESLVNKTGYHRRDTEVRELQVSGCK